MKAGLDGNQKTGLNKIYFELNFTQFTSGRIEICLWPELSYDFSVLGIWLQCKHAWYMRHLTILQDTADYRTQVLPLSLSISSNHAKQIKKKEKLIARLISRLEKYIIPIFRKALLGTAFLLQAYNLDSTKCQAGCKGNWFVFKRLGSSFVLPRTSLYRDS